MRKWYLFFLVSLMACQSSISYKSPLRQQLNLNIPSDPATFDPRKGSDLVSSMIHFLLYDGLTRLQADGQVDLALAEAIEISQDRTTYRFTLRKAHWSNGRPITALDFVQSWKSILDPSFPAPNAHLLYPIKNAEQVKRGSLPPSALGLKEEGDHILLVELEHPTPYFLELISFCVFFPVCRDLDLNWESKIDKTILSSGPFLLKEWKRGNEITLAKNPNYYRSERIQLPTIHISMIDSETTALQMYEKGELDILGNPLMSLPTEAIPKLAKRGELQIRPVGASTFCSLNIHRFPFTNVKIRKAFAYAINRTQIVENITQLAEEPALGIVPTAVKQNRHTAFFQDADIATARLLFEEGLEELGITRAEFPKISYYYAISELQHKVAQALQQQWQEAFGIQVQLQHTELKALLQLLTTRDYSFAQFHWMVQYQDPMNILERFKYSDNAKNYAGWENAAFIECLNESNMIEIPEKRLDLLEKAEKLMIDEMPIIPIFHWSSAFVMKDYVKNFNLVPVGNGFFDQVCLIESTDKR